MTTRLQPLVSEMFLGSWTDVTSLVERDNGNGIRIARKPLTWAEQVSPTTANWTFKNSGNNLYGRNPNSIYYGLLGRNTQVRHYLAPMVDTFTVSGSNGWPAADTGQSWTTTGGAPSDHSVPTPYGQQALTSTNVARYAHMAVTGADVTVRATMAPTVVAIGAAIEGQVWVRSDGTDQNGYRVVLSFQTSGAINIFLQKRVAGSITTLDSVSSFTTYGASDAFTVELSACKAHIRAKIWNITNLAESSEWELSAIDDTFTASGEIMLLSIRSTSNSNGTVNFRWDDAQIRNYRFWGEIPSFSPVRDSTGRFKSVPVTAAGISQRLSAGDHALNSAMTRAMDGIAAGDIEPEAIWPMEETAGATKFGNLRAGGPATVTGSVSPAGYSYSGPSGIGSVPVLNDGGQIAGVFPSVILETDASGGSIWQVQFVGVVPSGMSADTTFLDIVVGDSGGDHVIRFQVQWDATFDILTLRPFDRNGTQLAGAAIDFGSTPATAAALYDTPAIYGISIYQSTLGGLVGQQFAAFRPDLSAAVGFGGNVIGAGLTTVVPLPLSWRAYGTSVNAGWSFSHLSFYTSPEVFTTPNQQNNANALSGYNAELAGTRMLRVSGEENVPFELIGDAADTNPCGPQPPGKYIDVMVDAAKADQGVLLDARDSLSLQYITRSELENTAVDATFSYTGSQDLEAFQIIDDDRSVRNRITARRTLGSSFAIAEITEGPTSTAEPPDGIGVYPEDLAWNLATDDQLVPFAGWRALIKGWDEARYPGTAVWRERTEIANVPALDAAVLAMDIASHYVITDMPEDLPPDDVGLLVQGYSELLANFEHQLIWDGQPSGPYDVLELDDDDARADDDHFLRTAVDSTATSWEIANENAGIQLIADDAEDGWQWMIDGERVTVTDVTPPTISFVGVGTASSGSSGSRTPGAPAFANGDLVLIFASTRNSGTGIPVTPTDWHRFTVFETASNAQVFGRIKSAAWSSMPTVTYTGGAANEDTIAQSIAFSGRFNDITKLQVAFCGSLNPSAQDINISGIPIVNMPVNAMALYFGWKQDDFTSATQPGSWTEAQEASSTAGNDASQVWGYRQFTTRPTAGQLTPVLAIVGGASAISRGGVLVIASDYVLVTVTRSVNGVVKSHAANAVPMLIPASHVAM